MQGFGESSEPNLEDREMEKKPVNFRVAIFGTGGEQSQADLRAVENARRLAEQLIDSGFSISTGGYDKGVMGAATDSAYREAKRRGIENTTEVVKAFPFTENIPAGQKVQGAEVNESATLAKRLEHLIDESKAFVVFGGKLGTIVELLTAIHSESVQQMRSDRPAPKPTIIIDPELEHLSTLNQLVGNDDRLSKMAGLKHTYVLGQNEHWLDNTNRILDLYNRKNNGEELASEEQNFLNQSNYLESFNHWLVNTVKQNRDAREWPPGRGL